MTLFNYWMKCEHLSGNKDPSLNRWAGSMLPKYWKHYDDLHKNITDDSKLPRFYQEIVDDWIQEEEELVEGNSKMGKYLGMFERMLGKRDNK